MNKITYESTLSELQSDVTAKQAEAMKAADKVTKFVEIFGEGAEAASFTIGPPKGKPGRKPKDKTADPKDSPEPAAPKGKPGRKPKPKDESAADPKPKGKPGPKPKVAGLSRAAEGRRQVANGERPKLHDAMAVTAGDRIVNADTLFEEMQVLGWLPNSSDPRGYISYTFSSAKEVFEKVPAKGRGFYRVVSSYEAPAALVAQKNAKGSTPKASSDEDTKAESEVTAAPVEDEAPVAAPKAAVVKRKSTDDVLKDAGLDLGGPFGG